VKSRREIVPLTSLRGLAAMAVVAHHLVPKLEGLFPGRTFDTFDRGYLGVDVFFVLSGFVIAYNYADRIRSRADYRAFLGYRLARIYPLHLATLVGVVLMVHGAQALGLHIWRPERYALDEHLLLHLTLTHAWGFEEGLRFNLPSWSISAEWFAYLLFPLFWAVARRAGRRGAGVGAACSVLVSVLVLRSLGHDLNMPGPHALVRIGGEFLAGCLLYRSFQLRSSASIAASTVVESSLLLGVVLLAVSPWADPGMALGAVLAVHLLATGRGPLVRAVAHPSLAWLGTISYSIYLTHLPLLSVLERALPATALWGTSAAVRVATAALHVVLVVLVGAVGYYAVEEPARRVLRRLVRRRVPRVSWEKRV